MNIFIIKLITLSLIEFIVDAIAFGFIGYVIFHLLKGKKGNWFLGMLITFGAYLMLEIQLCNLLLELNVSFGNKDVYKVFGDDINNFLKMTTWDAIVSFILVMIGFSLAKMVFRKKTL